MPSRATKVAAYTEAGRFPGQRPPPSPYGVGQPGVTPRGGRWDSWDSRCADPGSAPLRAAAVALIYVVTPHMEPPCSTRN
jgi:hypothetical protein